MRDPQSAARPTAPAVAQMRSLLRAHRPGAYRRNLHIPYWLCTAPYRHRALSAANSADSAKRDVNVDLLFVRDLAQVVAAGGVIVASVLVLRAMQPERHDRRDR